MRCDSAMSSLPTFSGHAGSAFGADQLGRKVLPRKSSQNAILNTFRQRVRPLVDSLIADANRLSGRRNSAAK